MLNAVSLVKLSLNGKCGQVVRTQTGEQALVTTACVDGVPRSLSRADTECAMRRPMSGSGRCSREEGEKIAPWAKTQKEETAGCQEELEANSLLSSDRQE